MNFKHWQQALCAISLAAAAAGTAHATTTLTFDGIVPGTILFPGDSVVQKGYSLTALGGVGVIDTAAAFGPGVGLDLAGPIGNPGPFYIGLNDSFLRMRAVDNSTFRVVGLDFGFVSALTNLFNPGNVPGFLIAAFEDGAGNFGGEAFSFGAADANGKFSFQSLGFAGVGSLTKALRAVDFYACTADASGQCAAVNANFSQFALDNIRIPEPGSLALVLAALALTAGISRRKV